MNTAVLAAMARRRRSSGVAAPTITPLSPATGSTLGGESRTIIGTGFAGDVVSVAFGTKSATVTASDATTITVTVPHSALFAEGPVDVVVTVDDRASEAATYTYAHPDGLVSLWACDDGAGQVVTDYVGAANLQMGSAAGADTEDPAWVAAGLGLATGDYAQSAASPSVAQPNTHLVVVRSAVSAATSPFVFDGGGAGNRQNFTHVNEGAHSHAVYFWTTGGTSLYGADGSFPNDTWTIFVLEFNGASSTIRNQDTVVLTGNPGAAGIVGITLGARYSATLSQPDATYGLHAIFAKVLSSDERAAHIAAVKQIMAGRGVTIA